MAGVAAVAISLAGLIGTAAVATADPVVVLNGETVDPPTPALTIPWPGGDWAGHDWSKGWPGGGFAHGKGGGAAIHGRAGGAWNHTN
ncbi:hypothetical protein A5740_07590 [Mycobacterium sp. GA-1841]|nr:hypothetical protein A5740_07590 [Mycobacterium sp. GA-1841]